MEDNTALNHQESSLSNDKCPECNGTGWISFTKEINGFNYDFAKECKCQEEVRRKARYKNAMIPDEYDEYNFKNFEIREPIHDLMITKIVEYLKCFPEKKVDRQVIKGPSFGFIATYGEQRIKNIDDPQIRVEVKQKHNNYGVGKSHLTISAAKYLLKNDYRVTVVSDPVFIQDLMSAKFNNDNGDKFHKILSSITEYADFVVWDDLGKLKWTEPREDLYYQIFNELYKQGKPIIFSSNEDIETLSDKIGQAAASRLKGMCKGFIYPVEGKDQR
jgi:DNA replication protein DnaC